MIIGLCGFGFTGSGAVLDYLREYENIAINEKVELSFIYDPDALLDLENAICKTPIRYYSADAAIKKFKDYMLSYEMRKYMSRTICEQNYKAIVEQYISDITKISWYGFWHFDKRRISKLGFLLKYKLGWKYLRIFDKLNKPIPTSYPNNSKIRVPVDSDVFIERTKKFIKDVAKNMGIGMNSESGIIVLDQPFPANIPQLVYHLFWDDCKTIVVNRDPRDLYVFVKKYARLDANFIPYEDCRAFIEFYKYQMSICNYDDSVLCINFEDLIYDFDNISQQICNFINIGKIQHSLKYFRPEQSIGNTQLFKKHPEFSDDIKIIQKELSAYLYDFDRFGDLKITAKPFLYTI